eukprot:scaffold330_cov246-Pinguiococcus_pyrenoidosus.AAC.10
MLPPCLRSGLDPNLCSVGYVVLRPGPHTCKARFNHPASSLRLACLTERLAFLTQRLACLTERLACLTERLAFLTERLAFLTERLAFLLLLRRETL